MQIKKEKFAYLQIFLYLCTRKMKDTVSKIWHSPSARNVGKLLSANVIAQVLGILIYPVLTRLYAPEDFGLLNLFLSIGGVLALLSTCEYQSAILLPSNEKESAGVAKVAMCVIGIILLLIAITIPFSHPIATLFNAPALSTYYWLLVPYVGALGGWTVCNAWLTRKKGFGRISTYQLNLSFTGVLTKLLFGVLGWLRSGLILSTVFSPIIALTASLIHNKHTYKDMWQPTDSSLRELAHKYIRFPLYSMPRSLVNNLSGNLPALVLTPYFGLNKLGFFAMAMTLALRPITMITASVHQVLFERIAQAVRNNQSIWLSIKKWWLQMAMIVIPGMVLLTIFMPWLVKILLGAGWEETAVLIRFMMPWLTCIFLIAPLAFISEVFGKQKLFLGIEIAYLGLRIGAMVIGIWMNSFEWAIILLSIAGTTVLIFQLCCYIRVVRRYESTRLTQTSEQG